MVPDEKMGENPRKLSFRTLAKVAHTMQQTPVEKQRSARFVRTLFNHYCVLPNMESHVHKSFQRLRSFHRRIFLSYGTLLLASTFHLASGAVGVRLEPGPSTIFFLLFVEPRQAREYFHFLGENFQSMLAVSIAAGV